VALIHDTYICSDFLELREIQRSLPKASQIRDPARRPVPEYLCNVPVGLLPLLPDSSAVGSAPSSAPASPQSPTSPPFPNPRLLPTGQQASQDQPRTYLTHLSAAAPAPRRPKPSFTFLPLLDTCTTSDSPSAPCSSPMDSQDDESHDPPTPSLTLDSPSSRASSTSPDHFANFQCPSRPYPLQPKPTADSYFPSFSDTSINHRDVIPPPHNSSQDSLKPPLYTSTTVIEAGANGPIQFYKQDHGSTQDGIPQNSSQESNSVRSEEDEVTLSKALPQAYPQLSSPQPSFQPVRASNVSHYPSSPGPKPQSDQKRAPFFPFGHERDNISPSASPLKSSSDIRRSSARICARDLRPPSPIMAPYCVSRRRRTSPCPSPVMVSSPWCG